MATSGLNMVFGLKLSCDYFGNFVILQAAKLRWPALFDGVDSATEDWLVDQMIIVNNLWLVYFSLTFELLLVRIMLF